MMAQVKKPRQLEAKLEVLTVPPGRCDLEQYPTPPHIAAYVLWEIFEHFGSINNEVVLDLGCGNGILGIGSLLLGAKFVVAMDIDSSAIEVARDNASTLGFTDKHIHFVNSDISKFNIADMELPCEAEIDTVVMNPPFGTRGQENMDTIFVKKALQCADTVYSMHKTSTRDYWTKKADELKAEVKCLTQIRFNIERRFKYHKHNSLDITVDLIQFRRR